MSDVALVTVPPSPYKGLSPFDDSDSDALLFFGRARETQVVSANVLASRLTLLYGPSGVGKSSLLRAGVVHALRNAGDPPPAVVVYSSWTGDPLTGLEEAVRAAVGATLQREPVEAPGTFADRLAAWSAELGTELCLLLDQLEELFLYHPTAEGAGGFLDLLPELVGRPGLRVNVLLGIRDDALAQLDVFKGRIPGLFSNSLRLDHLNREAATAAIVGPLERYNAIAVGEVEIEPELVEAVLEEVQTGKIEPGSLGRREAEAQHEPSGSIETPYLQLVMQRVWEVERERGSRSLRVETFRGLGGAQRVVEDHLERALTALTPAQRDAAATVFGHLVTPSGTKIAHGVADLASYAAMAESDIEPVLRSLARERILRPLGENGHAAGRRYEIFHDVLGEAVLAWRTEHDTQRQLERERDEAERRHRRMLFLVIAVLIALGAMTAVAIFALAQREEARSQRAEARQRAQQASARELAARSVARLDTDPAASLGLALDAVRLDPSPDLEDVLRRALLESRARAVLPSKGPVTAVDVTRDGRRVVTASRDRTARLFDPRTGRQVRVFRGREPLTALSISPDGALIATGGGRQAQVWNSVDGKRLASLTHAGAVTDVEFSRDGSRLVTASADGTARVWEPRSGRQLLTLEHPGRVVSAAFDRSRGRLLTVASDRYVRVFDASTGALLQALEHPARVSSAAFSPSGRLIVSGSIDRRGRIWYVERGEMWKELRGHEGRVTDVAFSPSGRLVATASTDGTARVWSAANGTSVSTLFGHSNHVVDVAFSPDGDGLVTASRDRTARVWQARTGKPRAVLVGSEGAVTSAIFSPNGRTVVTASEDGTARVWDPQTEPELHVVARHGRPVAAAAFVAGGRQVVSAGEDGTARVETADGKQIAVVRHGRPVRALAVDLRGAMAATADDARVLVWETRTGRRVGAFRHPAPIRSVAISPDARVVATGAADGVVRLWDVRRGRLLRALPGHSGAVGAVSFSSDGRFVVSAGEDGQARIWDVRDGRLVHVLSGHRAALTSASFSQDGSRILTTSRDATARLWKASDGSLIEDLRGHRDAVTFGSFSADGSRIVTSSLDHDARLWDGRTGKALEQLGGHFAGVRSARFSPDGRWVVTAGPETAGLWQTATGRRVFYLRGHGAPLNDAGFSPDGKSIVTASDDGTARVYHCAVCGGLDELVRLAERRLALLHR
jgi:WD40 repeat protein